MIHAFAATGQTAIRQLLHDRAPAGIRRYHIPGSERQCAVTALWPAENDQDARARPEYG